MERHASPPTMHMHTYTVMRAKYNKNKGKNIRVSSRSLHQRPDTRREMNEVGICTNLVLHTGNLNVELS
jgi:hypothetical protein